MSGLEDMMAADLAALTGSGSDLPTAGTYAAQEGGSVAIQLFFGDPTDGLNVSLDGVTDNRTAPATTSLAAIVAGIGRNPLAGDTLTVATGANAGTWTVSGVQLDAGDGAVLALKWEQFHAAGHGRT